MNADDKPFLRELLKDLEKKNYNVKAKVEQIRSILCIVIKILLEEET